MAELKIDINGPEGLRALTDLRNELNALSDANNKAAKDYIEAAKKMAAENDKINKTLVETNQKLADKKAYISQLEAALKKYQGVSESASKSINEGLSETEQLLGQIKEWADKGIFNAEEVRVMTDLINDQGDAAENLTKVYEIVRQKLSELGDPALLQELDDGIKDVINSSGLLEEAVDNVVDSMSSIEGKGIFSPQELQALTTAVNEAKTETEALVVIHEALIDKQKQFAEGSKEWNGYAALIDEVDQAIAALSQETQENITKQQELSKQLKDVRLQMQDLAAAGDTTSEAYQQLEQQAGELQRAISVVNNDIRRAGASTPGLNKLIGVLKEVTAGFGLVQSAQALFGAESEGTQEALLKVTAVLTLLNSLQEIQTALLARDSAARGIHTAITKVYTWVQNAANASVHAFRAALVATGIGAFIVLIGTAISYLMDFSDATDEAARANDRLKESLDRIDKAMDRNSTMIKRRTEERIAQAKLAGKTEQELFEIRHQGLDEELENQKRVERELDKELSKSNLTAEQYKDIQDKRNASIDKQEEIYHQKKMLRYEEEEKEMNAADEKQKKSAGGRQKLRDNELEQIKKFNQDYARLMDQYATLSLEMIVNDFERQEAIAKQAYENELAALEKQHQELLNSKYITEEERLALDEKYIEAVSGLEVKYTRERIERKKDEEERIYQIHHRAMLAQLELREDNIALEIAQTADRFRELKEVYEKAGLDTEELIEAQLKAEQDIRYRYAQQELAEKLQTANKSIEILNVQGLDEKKATVLKNNLKLAAEKEYAKESLKILEQSTGLLASFSEEQLEAYREHVRKAVSNNENPIDIFEFLGIDTSGLSAEEKQQLYDLVGILMKETENAFDEKSADYSFGGIISSFFKWEGDDKEKATKALNDAAALTIDAYHQMMDAMATMVQHEIDLIDKKLDKYQEQIDAQKSMVDKEKELMEQGYANNYELEQKRLEDLKSREQEMLDAKKKAQEELQRIQKQQMIADYATTSASMIASVAQTIKGLSNIPVVGWVLGLAAAGSLIAGFVNLQARIKSLSTASFEKGGVFNMLDGQPSHAEGGVGVYNERTGKKLAEFEGNEKLFIVNKGSSGKYEGLLSAINSDDKASILAHLDKLGGSSLGFDDRSIDTFNRDVAYVVKSEAETSARIFNFGSPELKDMASTNRQLLEIEKRRKSSGSKGDFDVWESENIKVRSKKKKD